MEHDAARTSEPSSLAPLLRPIAEPAGRGLRLPLTARVLAFAVFVAVIPLLASGLSMLSSTREELKSAVNDRLLADVQFLLERIEGRLAPASQALSLAAVGLADPALDAEAREALLIQVLRGADGLAALEIRAPQQPSAFLLKPAFKAALDRSGVAPDTELAKG